MEEIQGKSILILGYGREGKSVCQYLLEHYADRTIGIADLKDIEDDIPPTVQLHTGSDYLSAISQYDTIVRSPGITPRIPELQEAIARGQHITSATNLFLSQCPGTVIGITGTKGKSTTSTLIRDILSQSYSDVRFVGNIGNPAPDSLRDASEQTLFVLELSSYQLFDSRYSPHIAVLLNIVPEHLDYHGGFADYLDAKTNIVRYQNEQGVVVANPNHKNLKQALVQTAAQKRYFTLENKDNFSYYSYVENSSVFTQIAPGRFAPVISLEDIPLLGSGNLENILAATTVGSYLQVSPDAIRTAIKDFKPLKHRLEFVGEYRGIRFYNDSIATVPEAAMHAIEAFGNDVETLIAGGHDRGLDFSEFGRYLAGKAIKTLILFPATGEKIWQAVCQAVPNEEMRPQKYDVGSMEEAIRITYQQASPGTVCLLSPASPRTRPLFRTFDERGNLFKKFARELGKSSNV